MRYLVHPNCSTILLLNLSATDLVLFFYSKANSLANQLNLCTVPTFCIDGGSSGITAVPVALRGFGALHFTFETPVSLRTFSAG